MAKTKPKLIHWAESPIGPLISVKNERINGDYHMKPLGLWVSAEGGGQYGWKQWCKDNDFRTYRLKYAYEVKLKANANILIISTPWALDDFTMLYRDEKSGVNKAIAGIGDKPDTMQIDWGRVSELYSGILIVPYQWELRLEWGNTWYYGWDCASGCIWDVSAIESCELVRSYKPRGTKKAYDAKMTKALDNLRNMTYNSPIATKEASQEE